MCLTKCGNDNTDGKADCNEDGQCCSKWSWPALRSTWNLECPCNCNDEMVHLLLLPNGVLRNILLKNLLSIPFEKVTSVLCVVNAEVRFAQAAAMVALAACSSSVQNGGSVKGDTTSPEKTCR